MPDPTIGRGDRLKAQARDAGQLLDYAIQTGFKTADGRVLSDDTIATIQSAAAKVEQNETITAADAVKFELAYYDLARLMSPVTAETLRDTEGSGQFFGASPAQRFTWVLWFWTLAFGIFIICGEWALQYMAVAADDSVYRGRRVLLELLVRPAYGGLGACVYLLRSAHTFIYQRTFDVHRKPEYLNRILLGTIAGGAIILFVNQLVGEEGAVIQLSSAALGFLAGYSTDFLFNTVERVIAAILPKVGIESMRRADAHATVTLDFKDVADRYDKAKGTDKELYGALLEQMTGARARKPRDGG